MKIFSVGVLLLASLVVAAYAGAPGPLTTFKLDSKITSSKTPVKCTATLKAFNKLGGGEATANPKQSYTGSLPKVYDTFGKFAGNRNFRNETLGSQPQISCAGGINGPGNNLRCIKGTYVPLKGQPVQGFSGIVPIRKKLTAAGYSGESTGEYWVVDDNGLGNKRNSGDCVLMWFKIKLNKDGSIKVLQTVFASDPFRKVPFVIANEGTNSRYLSGVDFDPESIQVTTDGFWIGDEIGPYLLNFNWKGQLTGLYEVPNPVTPGQPLRTPSNAEFLERYITRPDPKDVVYLRCLNFPNKFPFCAPSFLNVTVPRSGGFEGMALDVSGKYLYPMLERGVWQPSKNELEVDVDGFYKQGAEFVRVFKFDLKAKAFTGETFKYVYDLPDNSITDFNFINADYAMVLERDNGEGDASLKCAGYVNNTTPQKGCFEDPALFKRAFLVDFKNAASNGGFLKKLAYFDLLDIKDPKGVSPYTKGGKFTFPFLTPENLNVVEWAKSTVVLANDNNYPWSSGRTLEKSDDNEVVTLEVPGFFGGKC